MIQSAMMFALGALVSGLLALAFCVALVRRTRRITEKRLLAAIATRRAEFEAEREELRARHAVELFRLEKEVGRILDMATAHRLESDVKDRDLNSLHADLSARDEEIADLTERLAEARSELQDLEKRAAEAGTQLRASRHSLQLEVKRRATIDEQLDKALSEDTRRRGELTALRAENETLRTMLIEYQRAGYTKAIAPAPLPLPVPESDEISSAREIVQVPAQSGGSVVALPSRGRQLPPADAGDLDGPDAEVLTIERAAGEISRLSGEAEAGLDPLWHASARSRPAEASEDDVTADLRIPSPDAAEHPDAEPDPDLSPEERVFDAIAEIRALKRTAGQAGE